MINQMRVAILLLALTGPAIAQTSVVTVTKDAVPHKSLKFEVSIPAPLDAVWEAFATSQGLSTWLTPNAVVDLRPGGEWTAHYPGGKTGGGTILTFVPKREMVLSA